MNGKAWKWFASYLADRTQRDTVNDGLSTAFPLRKGGPQGSCLGSLQITVYTTKLFDIVNKHLPRVQCYTQMTHSCIWHSAWKIQTSRARQLKKSTSILFHKKIPYVELFSKRKFKKSSEFHFSRNRATSAFAQARLRANPRIGKFCEC